MIERCDARDVGGLRGLRRFRVAQHVDQRGGRQRIQRFLRAAHHVDRLAAPLDHDHLAGLELADVRLDRCAGRLGLRTRIPGSHERHGNADDASRTHDRGGSGQELPPPLVNALITHEGDSPILDERDTARPGEICGRNAKEIPCPLQGIWGYCAVLAKSARRPGSPEKKTPGPSLIRAFRSPLPVAGCRQRNAISAWSTADACAPCAGRPSCARPRARRGSRNPAGAARISASRRIRSGRA